MWYNYCNEPAGETEEEAREFAKKKARFIIYEF